MIPRWNTLIFKLPFSGVSLAQKKIIKLAQPKARPAEPRAVEQAPTKSARPKAGDMKKRFVVAIAGGLFFIYSISQFNAPSQPEPNTQQQGNRAASLGKNGSPQTGFAPVGSGQPLWDNPEPTLLERNFCLGNQNAASCSRKPRHPFSEEFGNAGWSEEEYIKFLGWDRAPSTDRDTVMGETVVYGNKAFKLFSRQDNSSTSAGR